ncbi:hypothetical protein [Rudanella paleaurantiibacter]|uniref:hypothetical protein n=1 Tax=Rudanella paleaurantiibacter TaxID=2614655 RepID=UPI001FE9CFF5|nr:hypothetical protein [Rudanella paleaurantiibacter]
MNRGDAKTQNGKRALVFLVLLLSLAGCYAKPDTFGKLDVAKWRSDRGGCNGVRATLLTDFNASRQEFKGVHVNDLGGILGRPDVNMIADRNQKYYVYFLEKGIHCDDAKQPSKARSVAFRVSAIGLVTEITFQNGTP